MKVVDKRVGNFIKVSNLDKGSLFIYGDNVYMKVKYAGSSSLCIMNLSTNELHNNYTDWQNITVELVTGELVVS